MAVSATLNTRDVSLNRKFSVGTKPSRKILIPVIKNEESITLADKIQDQQEIELHKNTQYNIRQVTAGNLTPLMNHILTLHEVM